MSDRLPTPEDPERDQLHEQLDEERTQRSEAAVAAASSSGSRKRPAEVPVEQADKERRDQVFREDGNAGVLTQVNERSFAAVSPQLTLNSLSKLYEDDGHEVYDQESLSAVIRELRRFGDLPTVAEIYSVPRVAAQAMTVGMRPGFSIDLGTLKSDGTSWNSEDDNDFRLLRLWREEKPFLLCGSPPCNAFAKMIVWNRSRMDPKKHEKMMKSGRLHLQRSCDLYRDQMRDGL